MNEFIKILVGFNQKMLQILEILKYSEKKKTGLISRINFKLEEVEQLER